MNIVRASLGVGDNGPAYKIGTLFGCADDLHSKGILQFVRKRDCPVTWSTNVHSIGSKSQVYSFLEEFPASHGDTVGDEHSFSPQTDSQSEKTI